jgi:hypothetical protein
VYQQWGQRPRAAPRPPHNKVLFHWFDAPSFPHSFAGHYIGQDPAAMADSFAEARAFFSERLAPKQ